jgi:hypothetical protein
LIPEEELNRAKNILTASVYANIERQGDRLEEMTKHVLIEIMKLYCYGRVRLDEYEEKIRAVTSQDIKNEMDRIFGLKPTFVALGNNSSLSKVGTMEVLKKTLKA